MRECAVVNASPLIYLSKIDRLPLLLLIAPRVLVPHAVIAEIAAKGQDDVTYRAVQQQISWLVAQPPVEVPAPVLAWDLCAGESAVIATALCHTACPDIIDDGLGRKCAQTLGLELFGTLGLVLIAKQRGVINSARTLLADLRVNGMYLSPGVVERAVMLVGE